jgi:magnesium transporter
MLPMTYGTVNNFIDPVLPNDVSAGLQWGRAAGILLPERIFRRTPMQQRVLLETIDGLLANKEDARLKNILMSHTPQEIARVINQLPHGKRKSFAILPPEVQADVVLRLSEQSRTYVLPRISDHAIARMLHFTEEDDAADLLQLLEENRRPMVLQHMKPEKRSMIEKLLRFDPETAGGLMDLNYITVPMSAAVRDVSEAVRHHLEVQKKTPMVIVMDEKNKARGFLPHKNLFLASPHATAGTMMHRLPTMPHSMDQEKIVRLAMRERGEVFGVTTDDDRLLGVIHMRDLLRIAQFEATEDVYKFAGVSHEENMLGSPWSAVRLRHRWLIVNLGTAFLASWVVSLFEGTISQLAILAVYMPIVAGMGGNAGTQALAVAVRGLALSDITNRQKIQLIAKEILAGAVNGAINGVIVAAVVILLGQRMELAIILGASMVINLVVAGIFGALIPLILKTFRVDPAVASTVFVTTATDCCGFFAFLGLATYFLL